MTNRKPVEVLAPAGSYESMTAAVSAGADAVYIGGARFGARAYADNLDQEQLLRAIDYVHLHGRRLYLTVNTLFKEQELEELYDYLKPFYEQGLDSVIVQDLGAVSYIREHFPGLPIHASTQMTITGPYGAKLLKDMGASRVVTARELSLEEIRQIHEQVDIEIESFVHGALCYCYSGQCLMSSLIGGRSGNRGRCAQTCRLPFEVKRGGRTLNSRNERYVLSLKDLCTLDILPDILDAGVYSLKIEGRMKSPRYTAGVVAIYRKYVDRYLKSGREGCRVSPADRKILLDLFDRGGLTDGYYQEHNGRDMVVLKEKPAFKESNSMLFEYLDQTYVETPLQKPVKGFAYLQAGSPVSFCLEAEGMDGEIVSVSVEGAVVQEAQKQPMTREKVLKQLEKTGNTLFHFEELDAQVEGEVFLPVQALNELRRKGLEALEEALLAGCRRQEENTGTAVAAEGCEEARTSAAAKNGEGARTSAAAKSGEEARTSASAQSGENAGTSAAAKNGESAGEWTAAKSTGKVLSRPLFIASLEEQEQLEPALSCPEVDAIYLDADGFPAESWRETAESCHEGKKQCLLMMPHIFRQEAEEFFTIYRGELETAGFDGVVVRSLEEAGWIRAQGLSEKLPMVFDASLYTWNHRAIKVMEELGAVRTVMPVELTARELKARGSAGQEILIYGSLPMMVSAQCIRKTTEGCSRRREILYLKDRTGKQMAVKNHCTFCYNTIYNASPLSLLGMEEQVKGLMPGALRLQFTTESSRETARCLRAFADGFLYGKKAELPFTDYTRGHIKRGVE